MTANSIKMVNASSNRIITSSNSRYLLGNHLFVKSSQYRSFFKKRKLFKGWGTLFKWDTNQGITVFNKNIYLKIRGSITRLEISTSSSHLSAKSIGRKVIIRFSKLKGIHWPTFPWNVPPTKVHSLLNDHKIESTEDCAQHWFKNEWTLI